MRAGESRQGERELQRSLAFLEIVIAQEEARSDRNDIYLAKLKKRSQGIEEDIRRLKH